MSTVLSLPCFSHAKACWTTFACIVSLQDQRYEKCLCQPFFMPYWTLYSLLLKVETWWQFYHVPWMCKSMLHFSHSNRKEQKYDEKCLWWPLAAILEAILALQGLLLKIESKPCILVFTFWFCDKQNHRYDEKCLCQQLAAILDAILDTTRVIIGYRDLIVLLLCSLDVKTYVSVWTIW